MIIKKGYRKLAVYLIGLGIASVALFVGRMTAQEWSNVAIWLSAAFMGGNSLEHLWDNNGKSEK